MFGVSVEATLIRPTSAAATAAKRGLKRGVWCLIRGSRETPESSCLAGVRSMTGSCDAADASEQQVPRAERWLRRSAEAFLFLVGQLPGCPWRRWSGGVARPREVGDRRPSREQLRECECEQREHGDQLEHGPQSVCVASSPSSGAPIPPRPIERPIVTPDATPIRPGRYSWPITIVTAKVAIVAAPGERREHDRERGSREQEADDQRRAAAQHRAAQHRAPAEAIGQRAAE